jgi:ribosomal protein L7/L12
LQAIRDAIFAGRKIEAIKQWRELTSSGLAEAKETIERLAAILFTIGMLLAFLFDQH